MSRHVSLPQHFVGLILVLAAIAAACTDTAPQSDGAHPDRETEWGSEAVAYFDRLGEVYTANDFYGILDFYTPVAEIEQWRGDNRGGWPVPDLIRWNSSDLGFEVVDIDVGTNAALTLVRRPNSDDVGAVISDIDGGRIDREVDFDLADTLERSLRATPGTIRTYEGLYRAYAAAWSSGDPEAAAHLYAANATIGDVGIPGQGRPFSAVVATSTARWEALAASDVFAEQSDDAPALFLGPSEYGLDPERAVGVYRVTDDDGCQHDVGVRWELEDGFIVAETRFHQIESYRACAAAPLAEGWWTGLTLPGPSDQIVTEQIQSVDGSAIEVRNGTDALVDLLVWGLVRFADNGLSSPEMDAVTFEPSRSCLDRSGRVLDDGTVRNLYVCMYDSDVCTTAGTCAVPGTSARIAMLHELAHAWMIDHVDDQKIEDILEVSGRSTWDDVGVPWVDRGVEYAADVVAWGLLEETLPLVRLGAPPCRELVASFTVITGSPPPHRCA